MAAEGVAHHEGIEAQICSAAAASGKNNGICAEVASAGTNQEDQVAGCSENLIGPDNNDSTPGDGVMDGFMSKNQQKKLRRQAAFEAKKAAKKMDEKAAKRVHQERKLSEVQKMIASMSETERQAWEEQMAQKRQARKQSAQEKKARLQQAQREGQRFVIDLDFADKMTPAEIKSLCQQLLYAYSANTRSQQPAQLIFTSLQGVMSEQLRKQASGLDNWVMTTHAEPYMTVFRDSHSDLVYLTADSPNELKDLDPSKAYIIGGIVDRNRHKNICLDKAVSQGISTARLPIGDYLHMNSSPVITVNQVFSILVNYLEHNDWRTALETTIPQRKQMDGTSAGTPGLKEDADGDIEPEAKHIEKKRKLESSNEEHECCQALDPAS